jgi:hypothetical protein
MINRIIAGVRGNLVAWLALFVALGGRTRAAPVSSRARGSRRCEQDTAELSGAEEPSWRLRSHSGTTRTSSCGGCSPLLL